MGDTTPSEVNGVGAAAVSADGSTPAAPLPHDDVIGRRREIQVAGALYGRPV